MSGRASLGKSWVEQVILFFFLLSSSFFVSVLCPRALLRHLARQDQLRAGFLAMALFAIARSQPKNQDESSGEVLGLPSIAWIRIKCVAPLPPGIRREWIFEPQLPRPSDCRYPPCCVLIHHHSSSPSLDPISSNPPSVPH